MLGQTAWAGPCNAAETFVSYILVDVSEPPRPAVLEYIQIQSQTEPQLAPFVASRAHGILTQEYWNIFGHKRVHSQSGNGEGNPSTVLAHYVFHRPNYWEQPCAHQRHLEAYTSSSSSVAQECHERPSCGGGSS